MDKLKLYLNESYDELMHKVTWPTWEEVLATGRIVLVASVMFAFTVFAMDFVFGANPENPLFRGVLYYVYQIFG